jgi:hypothetical protein
MSYAAVSVRLVHVSLAATAELQLGPDLQPI